jgi:hypothetical protein
MQREPIGSSEPVIQDAVSWYARAEIPGPWRIQACREHGVLLERNHFERLTSHDPLARGADSCAICRDPALLQEVDRCTCEYDPARCPAHQNIGCGG